MIEAGLIDELTQFHAEYSQQRIQENKWIAFIWCSQILTYAALFYGNIIKTDSLIVTAVVFICSLYTHFSSMK